MKTTVLAGAILLVLGLQPALALAQNVVLVDSLRGSTKGTQGGGAFQADGWRVTGKDDFIYWHIPTLRQGAVEWSVRGLRANDSRPEGADKNEIFHMYDWSYNNADTVYDGYRNGPYKHFIRKTNVLDPARMDSLELVWVIAPNYVEPDTRILTWDPAVTYRFREEWGPDGAGNTEIRTYRDGEKIMTMSVAGSWNPTGHALRIAASTRAPLYSDFGAPIDAVYSDVQVWDAPLGGGIYIPSDGSGSPDNPNGDRSFNDTLCGLTGLETALAAMLLAAWRRRRQQKR